MTKEQKFTAILLKHTSMFASQGYLQPKL